MKFWGAEVKPGEPLMVTPEDNIIHISQASLDCKGKMGETVVLSVNVDGAKLVIGTLSQDKFPQISLDLFFDKNFELSHNGTKASVHFIGYKSPNIDQDQEGDDYSGSDEEVPAAPNIDQDQEGSGSDEEEEVPAAVPAPVAANRNTGAAASTKPKAKPEEVKPESDDDSDDKDDESHDDDDSVKGMEVDEGDSTDQRTVEAATQKSKREESDDDDDSVMGIAKKQRQEIAEMNRSLKDMSGFIKKNSLQKSDLEDILLKVKETPNNKVEPTNGPCCFEVEGAEVNNPDTIFVSGFDCSLSRDDIKSTLKKHFRSCGVLRVFVPIQCQTGYPLGFAFLNLRAKHEKALALNGSFLGGLKLVVAMAIEREEYSDYPDFQGCHRCIMAFHQRLFTSFIKTSGGRLYHWKPNFDIGRLGPCESYEEPLDEDSE